MLTIRMRMLDMNMKEEEDGEWGGSSNILYRVALHGEILTWTVTSPSWVFLPLDYIEQYLS